MVHWKYHLAGLVPKWVVLCKLERNLVKLLALCLVPDVALTPGECWVDVLPLGRRMLTFDGVVVPEIRNSHDHGH